ncbi:hypothetical protein QNM97_13830 [Gordonia sp. L191]|uniref:hypothetical protein n=1 Tax=Gordonia sp. L191 TaxID=2982699 RepID=UPI0024C0908F|nr:hypothetical protein [Gordonia sp. L191]WHU45131.1 hypothetical protein QNM97_13830 [Gordonia sp. L191]
MIGRKKPRTIAPRAPKQGSVEALLKMFTLTLQRAGATVDVQKSGTRTVVMTISWKKGQ